MTFKRRSGGQTSDARLIRRIALPSWESRRVRSPNGLNLGFYGEPSRAAKVWTLWGAWAPWCAHLIPRKFGLCREIVGLYGEKWRATKSMLSAS
jgi:hypothetical protein